MTVEEISARLEVHRALADPTRLAIVDALALTDLAARDLGHAVGASSNLLAFHLAALERAGLVRRQPSQGDARRRYVGLTAHGRAYARARLDGPRAVLFVCSRNAARSQLAAALWRSRTGGAASSAGSQPAASLDDGAVRTAREHGLALDGARPRGYAEVEATPDLVVSVCDRAGERGVPFDVPRLHWSVRDPHGRGPGAYTTAYDELSGRVDHLAAAVGA